MRPGAADPRAEDVARPNDPLDGLVVREPAVDDHRRVLDVMDAWWGGVGGTTWRAAALPKLFFQHFAGTSMLLERDGELVGFVVGFLSQRRPEEAYVHFVGWRQACAAAAWARPYRRFFALVQPHGCTRVRWVTSPANRDSIAFHRAIGFEVEPGDGMVDGVPVVRDYDGPGLDRVGFVRQLGS